MYIPPHFRVEDQAEIHAAIRAARLASLVMLGGQGLTATPLPMLLDAAEGPHGTLYAHLARANPQWREARTDIEAMAIFMGPDAYVSPGWYATKRQTGKVVPTWNYEAVHAYGRAEFFEDAPTLLSLVTRLTQRHEAAQASPWAVSDAPAEFVGAQLRGIVGVRIPISRLECKRKASQNRPAGDRAGVRAALAAASGETERAMAALVPE